MHLYACVSVRKRVCVCACLCFVRVCMCTHDIHKNSIFINMHYNNLFSITIQYTYKFILLYTNIQVGGKKLDELAASVRDKLQQRIGHQVS